jgi:hypothetical protein
VPEDNSQPSVSGFIGNIGSSVGNLIGGVANAVVHPVQTAENLLGTVAGAGEKLFGVKNQDTQKFDNMVSYFGQRYGGDSFSHVLGNIAHTAYTDPAGMALDVSTLLDGVGGAIGAVSKVSKIAELGDVADAIRGASSALNPISQGAKMVTGPANALADYLPKKVLESAVPGLKRAETTEAALNNLSFGSIGKNLVQSDLRKQSMYQGILSDIRESGLNGDVGPGFKQELMSKINEAFPNLGKSEEDIFKSLKSSAGTEGGLVDKLQNGEPFTLEDSYKLKSNLESNAYKLKIDSSEVKVNKDLAATAGGVMGDILKEAVPGTNAKFAEYAKEINWNKALKAAASKRKSMISYKDVAAFLGGQAIGVGGIPALALEKIAESPTAKLNIAKALNVAKPIVKGAVKATRVGARAISPGVVVNSAQGGQ